MRFHINDITQQVRIILEENRISDNMMDDIETLSINEIILSKIEDAARTVILEAPTYMLDSGSNFADSIYWDEDVGLGSGWTVLPEDFFRLIAFKMSDWERTVYEAILPGNPVYKLQSSRIRGIRGNPHRPVCAIIMKPVGRVLEFFSCKQGEDVYVETAIYAPIPKIEENTIDIYERCFRSVLYRIAGLTMSCFENKLNIAANLFKISDELLK